MRRALITGALATALAVVGCLDRDLRPLNPCTFAGESVKVTLDSVDEVDLLFVIDDSGSMSQEQAKLREEIPRLVEILASGDLQGDGERDFTPVKSLQVGIVSSNMGSNGINPTAAPTCAGFGDDGVLESGACGGLPNILRFEEGDDVGGFVADVECATALGTSGCGVEQQLEAMLKAVTPSTRGGLFSGGTVGHGDGANAGFLREDSLLAVVLVTDEEDCSTPAAAPFDLDNEANRGALNTLCTRNRDLLHPVERYVDGLLALRDPSLVVFGLIAGMPPELTSSETVDYDAILAHPDMSTVEMSGTEYAATYPGESNPGIAIRPVCSVPDRDGDGRFDTIASPARRMVALAQRLDAMGGGATVQSICQDTFTRALDNIIAKIADALDQGCLERPLVRDALGEVSCSVVEELPAGMRCADLESIGREPSPLRLTADGREVCRVLQVPVEGDTVPAGLGWYYDDFSPEVRSQCVDRTQRIAFTGGAVPPSGTVLRLECLQALSDVSEGVGVGFDCGDDASVCTGARADVLERFPQGLVCEPNTNTCQPGCESTADCPGGYTCHQNLCVNPTCEAL